MTRKKLQEKLLLLPMPKFVEFFNENIVDPFGDFWWAKIYPNTKENLFKAMYDCSDWETLVTRGFADYDANKQYFILDGDMASFDDAEEFLATPYGEGMLDEIMNNLDFYVEKLNNL